MPTEHFILVRTPLVSLPPWQKPLDAEGWPVRLIDVDGSFLDRAVVSAEIKGLPVKFNLERLTYAELDAQWHAAPIPDAWPFGIRVSEYRVESLDLRMRSGIACTAAAYAYGIAADGLWYRPSSADQNVKEMGVVREALRRDFPIWVEVMIDRQLRPNP